MKIFLFWFEFRSSLQVRIGSGNGLAPIRWQAITWSDDDPVRWWKYASPGLDELMRFSLIMACHMASRILVNIGLGDDLRL